MKISQTIPKEQVKIILEGLKLLEFHLNILDDSEKSQNVHYKQFDILQLKALLEQDVVVEMSKEDFDNFTSNYGVDFPEYLNDPNDSIVRRMNTDDEQFDLQKYLKH